ncbi:MAG: protein kinase [Xanthomonadales bacterium]|nr:protein kinase [Xanthomonadales bacterium]
MSLANDRLIGVDCVPGHGDCWKARSWRDGYGSSGRTLDGAFDKRVMIKLLRDPDLRFKQHLERERRVLARLEHPAIARLLDGGETADGQPYLVMELAEGLDLDKWLQARTPDLDTRLRAFLQVCGRS